MSKKYSVFAKAYKKGIIIGFRTIDDVRPEALRNDVIELLAMDGLGPDGKPLAKDHIGPKGEPGEPANIPEEGNKEGDTESKEAK